VRCLRDYTLDEYQGAIAVAVRRPPFIEGTPVLLDIRQSTVILAHEDYERRSQCLANLAPPGTTLRVAVLTTEGRIPVALRSLNVMADLGIHACAFTDLRTATAWLCAAAWS
jgi:hypothetical protein